MHVDPQARAVRAAPHCEHIIGHDSATHVHQRARAQRDVGAVVKRADLAADDEVAVARDRDRSVHRRCRPGARARGVDADTRDRAHLEARARARGGGAGAEVDAAGGEDLPARLRVAGSADHEVALRLHHDLGTLPGVGRRCRRVEGHALACGVVGEGVVLPGAKLPVQRHRGAANADRAVVAGGVQEGVPGHGDCAARQQFQVRSRLQHRRARLAGGGAEHDGVGGVELDRVPRGLGAEHHVPQLDVVAGIDLHRALQADRAVQEDIARGVDTQFVVVGDVGGAIAAHHACHVDVATRQHDGGAGLKPSRGVHRTGQDAQVTLGRTHLQQRQVRTLADRVADQHVIHAVEQDAAARPEAGEIGGAVGAQADLAGLLARAGIDDDVALRRELAAQREGACAVDQDVGVGATGDEVALNGHRAGRVQHHGAAQRFDQAGRLEVHAQRSAGAGTGMHLDAAVRANGPAHRDHAGRCPRLAEVHDGTASAGIDGIRSARGLRAVGRRGVAHLGESQALGAAQATCQRRHADLLVARQHQPAVVEPDFDPAIQRCGIDGGLEVSHQRGQALITPCAVARCDDDVGLEVHGTVLDRDAQPGGRAQVPVGELGKAVGHQLLCPDRRENRHVAGTRKRDRAVVAPGADLHVSAHDQAFVSPGVSLGRLLQAAAAADVNGLARQNVATEPDLLVGADAYDRVSVEVAHRAAEVEAGGVVAVDHLPASHQLAHQPGVLCGVDAQFAVWIGHRQQRRRWQAHALAVGIGAPTHIDERAGPNAGSHLDLIAVQ